MAINLKIVTIMFASTLLRDIEGADKKAIFDEALKSNNTNLILEFALLNKELGLTKLDLKRILRKNSTPFE
jgi:6-phosphogluconolactonase/glucosamine-6-phosphate isomerase/deaminase